MADDFRNYDLWLSTDTREEPEPPNAWAYRVCKRDHRTYTNMSEKQLNDGGCYDCVFAKERAA